MPPSYVKKTGQLIHYYYAKLVIAPSAGLAGNFGFITDRYKALESGRIEMSNHNRELWLKETEPQSMCAYCNGPGPLVGDHVIPLAASGPDAMHNILRVCRDCNATKSDRDLIEWWNAVHGAKLGDASVGLPRLAAGVYLKIAYDWHRVNNTLETPARDLGDLQPFRTPSGRKSRQSGPTFAGSPARAGQPERTTPRSERVRTERAHVPPEPAQAPAPTDALALVLNFYLYKEDVQQLLSELEQPTAGPKDELISRLMQCESFDPRQALRFLDKGDLARACDELGLPSDGLFRGSLEGRVLGAILAQRRPATR